MARRGGSGVKVYIDGDTSGLDGALRRADRGIAGFGRGLAMGGLRTGALAAGAALTGLGIAAADGVRSLARIEEINAQTTAGIRSTGGAANVTRQQVEELAGSIETLTGVEAENIQQGQNLLLTFTNVRNEVGAGNRVFDEATQLMVDMSVRMKTDMSSSAMLLGKALNDPVRGVTALSRAGVQFTATQREQIKALTESGDLLGAQKIVLGELETQFGGSSEAFGQTMTGKVQRFGHAVGTVQEALVAGLLPGMERATDYAVDHLAPKLNTAAERITAIWDRPGLTPEDRFTEAWKVIEDTGIPDAAGRAILRGLELVGTQGPAMIIKGLQEAPWPAKAVIGAILLAKLGPGIALAGRGLGAALGTAVPGGIAGGRGRGAAGPVPVLVTNPGFVGGPGGRVPGPVLATTPAGRRIPLVQGVPGGGLIAPPAPAAPVVAAPGMFRPGVSGAAGRAGPGALTGLTVGTLSYAALSAAGVPGAGGISTIAGGAATGATIGAGAGLPGILVGAVAGGTLAGLTLGFKRFAGSGEVEALEKRVQETTARLTEGMSEQGRGRVERATRDLETRRLRASREDAIAGLVAAPGINISAGARQERLLADRTRAALSDRQLAGLARTQGAAVARSWAEGLATGERFPGLKPTIDSAKRTMAELEPAARETAARAMVAQSQELERSGKLPRGATARLLRELRADFESELGQLPRTVPKVMAQVGRELADKRALRGLNTTLREAAQQFGDVPKLAALTAGNARENYERVMRGLAKAAREGGADQKRAAEDAMQKVRAAHARQIAANLDLGASYDGSRLKALAAGRVFVGMARDAANAWATAAVDIGNSAARAADGVEAASRRIARAPVAPRNTAAPAPAGGARGWMIPGTYRGVDDRLAMVASGEVILTPNQQRMVEAGVPIRQALLATGGRIGEAYAAGGFVGQAYGRAVAELGDPYGKPSRGESRTGPNSWDCSGYATHVAQVNVGGTTASAYPSSSPARGTEPVLWGFRKSHSGGYRGGYDEHMGVGVADPATGRLRWFDAGSGGVESNADSTRWQEVRVPRGLESLSLETDGGRTTKERTEGRGTPRQELVKSLRAAGIKGAAASGIANRALQAGADVPAQVEARTGGGDLAGERAGLVAADGFLRPRLGARVSPEEEATRIEQASNAAERRHLERDLATVGAAMKKLGNRLTALARDERRLLKTKKSRARTRALGELRRAMKTLRDNRLTLLQNHTHIRSRLAEIGASAAAAGAAELLGTVELDGERLDLLDAVEGVGELLSNAGRDDSLQDKRAAKAGTAAAAAEGITNRETLQARGELAVLQRRRAEVQQLAGEVKGVLDAVLAERARLIRAWQAKYRDLGRTNKRRKPRLWQSHYDAIQRINAALELIDGREDALRSQYADLEAQAAELGFDIGELTDQIAQLPRVEEPATSEATEAAGSAGPTEAQTAAEAAAAAARREAGLANSFIRAAFSPGDIGAGGLSAIAAAGGSVNYIAINTLLPSDPQTLEAIGRSVSASQHQAGPILTKTIRTGL